MASRMVSGTPVAVVVELPKLERMSWRTTPLCSRMSGPLEPSPGYGPAVSSGMSAQLAASALAEAAAVAAALELRAGAGRAGGDPDGDPAEAEDLQHLAAIDEGHDVELEALVDDRLGRVGQRPALVGRGGGVASVEADDVEMRHGWAPMGHGRSGVGVTVGVRC